MEYKGRTIEDEFQVELRIPPDYPASPPDVYEIAGRLDGFDHLFDSKKLCLGAPIEVRMRFAKRPNLLRFTEDLVVPFLFSFSYKARYGKMPFGELAHGTAGILDYYNSFFETPTERTMLLLKYLAGRERDGSEILGMCPCGSGRKLKRCHGRKLNVLRSYQTAQDMENLVKEMVSATRMIGNYRRPLLSRRLRRKLGGIGDSQANAQRGRKR